MANVYFRAIIVGFMAGMRSLVTPSIVSESLAKHRTEDGLLALASSPHVRGTLKAAATAELVCDKLPFMPDRTDPPSLAFRFVSGALSAAAICRAEGQNAPLGAAIGGLSAVISAHACYYLRREIVESDTASDTLAAVVEDAMVVAMGRLATEEHF